MHPQAAKLKTLPVALFAVVLVTATAVVVGQILPIIRVSAAEKASTLYERSLTAAQKASFQRTKAAGKRTKLRAVPNEILVKFKTGFNAAASAKSLASEFAQQNLKVVSTTPSGIVKLRLEGDSRTQLKDGKIAANSQRGLENALAALRKQPNIATAEPNRIYETSFAPNDPQYPQQWGLQRADSRKAWNVEKGSAETIIAIIDSGVDFMHADLKNKMVKTCDDSGCADGGGYDFVNLTQEQLDELVYWFGYEIVEYEDYFNFDNKPDDANGHGTHVAGIAAAETNNGKGVAGVCMECRILPVRAGFSLISAGNTYGFLTTESIVESITYAGNSGADIINMSFTGEYSELVEAAVNSAAAQGSVLVAAAGNEGSKADYSYPAALANVISVAALSNLNASGVGLADYSNYGFTVDVAAPGTDIVSTFTTKQPDSYPEASDEKYETLSGTSMASPFVAGALGLLKSKYPDYSAAKLLKVIEQASTQQLNKTTPERYYGVGGVNLNSYVRLPKLSGVNAVITSPAKGAVAPANLAISGQATGAKYKVEYGYGFYPLKWTTIADKIGQSQTISLLGNAHIKPKSRPVTVKLTVTKGAKTAVDYLPLTAVVEGMEAGWPKAVGGVINHPTLVDLDGDGVNEIVLGETNVNKIQALKKNGQSAPGWPVELPFGENAFSSGFWQNMAAADIDGDGKVEVVGASWDGYLFVLSNTGVAKTGWPYYLPAHYQEDYGTIVRERFTTTPVLANVDADPQLEITVISTEGLVYVLNHDGTLVSGWPQSNTSYKSEFTEADPIVADVDANGTAEIIAVSGYRYGGPEAEVHPREVRVYSAAGEVLSGWPKTILNTSIPKLEVANLDGDANLEILTTNYDEAAYPTISAYELNGAPMTGWPVELQLYPDSYPGMPDLRYSVYGDMAVVDLSGDGKAEIATSIAGHVVVFNRKGKGVLVKKLGDEANTWIKSLLAADIDRDGKQELIFSVNDDDYFTDTPKTKIYALRVNGDILPTWPRTVPYLLDYLSIGSIDVDKKLEIVGAGFPFFEEGQIYVIQIAGSKNKPEFLGWPTYKKTYARNGGGNR